MQKPVEVFLCFVTIIFVLSFVLTSLFFLFYVRLVKVIGFYTEDEPNLIIKNCSQHV